MNLFRSIQVQDEKSASAQKQTAHDSRCESGILSRGAKFLRPKVADIVKWSCVNKASNPRLGSMAHLRALEAFGFLILKYVSHC